MRIPPLPLVIEATYNNGTVPPPYNYEYTIRAEIHHNKPVKITYQLNYRFREQITPEEIEEEGFSSNDDYQATCELPNVWEDPLRQLAGKTTWPKNQEKAAREEPYLHLKLADQNNEQQGVPSEKEAWEYLLQEVVQAVYEVTEKEMPLEIRYLEIVEKDHVQGIDLKIIFSQRKAVLTRSGDGTREVNKYLEWKEIKQFLKKIYIPDYDPEEALPKLPKRKGKFIDIGEGVWYEFGKGAYNPSSEFDALAEVEELLKRS